MNQLFHFYIKSISFFTYTFGRAISRGLFSILGFIWFDVVRIRRKDILNHLEIAFPELTIQQRISLGRKSMFLMTGNLADLFVIPYIDQKWLDKHTIVHGAEHVVQALAAGKGLLMLGMHVGNGDLAANLIALRKWPIHLITKFFKNQRLNKIWFALRGYHGVNYIEPHGEKTPFQILKALKANGMVVFVLDQFMGKPYGIETTFFGRKTGTAQGLALFYLKTKAPVIPVYCYEGEDKKFHLVFEPALPLSGMVLDDKKVCIAQLTQYFCDVTEVAIRQHPADWMWLHRRWKKFE